MEWGFIWMMFALKIPIAALLWLVWWAIKSEPVTDDEPSGGGSEDRRHGPRPRNPRPPRRGPHAEPAPAAPTRVRVAARPPVRTHD